jgi:type IV pilus assembly protein PilC
MIKAGEASGQLDAILSRLAEYLEASEALKREIKSAMTYPVVSLFLIITITIGLLVGIVPKFITIFEQLEIKELPLPTEILMGVSNTLQTNFMAIIVVVVGIFIVFKIYVKTRFGRLHWDWVKLHLPVFGALFQKVAISRFSRTFATLIKSGVPIVGALEIVARTSGNALIENAVLRAREKVIKGETLADPLAESRLFPPMVTRMVGIGEKSGALEQLLTKISEFYDQEVKTTVAALSSLIEPLLIAFMGSLVGLIVLSIFLPILKVQEKLAKK